MIPAGLADVAREILKVVPPLSAADDQRDATVRDLAGSLEVDLADPAGLAGAFFGALLVAELARRVTVRTPVGEYPANPVVAWSIGSGVARVALARRLLALEQSEAGS